MKLRYARLSVFSLLTTLLAPVTQASPLPLSIPRVCPKEFRTDGSFEGGSLVRVDLKNLRYGEHEGDVERWVVDFSDPRSGSVGSRAPRFQIRYVAAESFLDMEGRQTIGKPAKFQLLFRSIAKNWLSPEYVRGIARRSRFVSAIVQYPPIEGGDLALEFILRENVQFSVHQPIERPGRVVLDIKHLDPSFQKPVS